MKASFHIYLYGRCKTCHAEEKMKRLYVVKDIPKYQEDCSSYCYVVKAETEIEAINIVRQKTKHQWDWGAELTDNTEVWIGENSTIIKGKPGYGVHLHRASYQ